ncbi:autophagy-related protein 2 homolog A-like [Physella acuta]|uniref:autophagy-related protein 2 homolog A-like n=1 Tax=Physella acuta TaxID=109671 RepID=UPI0027DACB36|nr:autophagy-related protein 2 homolog A-like [Physella acuta]
MSKLDSRVSLHKLRDSVASILPLDHLGLLAKPVHASLVQEKKSSESKHRVKVTFGKLEVIECLFDCVSKPSDFAKTALPKLPQYSVPSREVKGQKAAHFIELLAFDVNGLSDSPAPYDPSTLFNIDKPKLPQSALTVTLDSIQTKRHQRESPGIRLMFDFNKMASEVDVTIIDRLTNLIHYDNRKGSATNVGTHLMDTNGHVGIDDAIRDEQAGNKFNLEIRAKAVQATFRVRFPVPDLRVDRPTHSREWWRRNLHKEILLLEMESPDASSNLKQDEPLQLELQVFKISAYLQEDINKDPILFGEVTVDDPKATPYEGTFNWPRIVINVSHKANSVLEAEEESDASATSMDNYMEPGLLKKESGPFSKKKSLYARDDLSFNESVPVNDEMVMPGDTAELRQFRDECLARTCLSVDITVPSVTAFIHSREFLELLYNRFNNDLLMWEPQPPRTHSYMNTMIPSNTNLGVLHMLQNQGGEMSADDEDPSDSDDDGSMHYSIHDHKANNKATKIVSPKLLNKMCFSLSIGNGKLLAVIPHVDMESNPDLHGEVLITLKDGLLFSVNEHGGDPDLKYLCLQTNRAQLYHNAHVTLPVKPGSLDLIRDKIPDHLKSKIYRSDRWVSDKSQGRAGWGADSPDMVTLVVKTKMDTLNNVKNFTLALRVDGATLRHEMHRTGESWISQLIDLFDLKDFPILGYTMPKVMTEIHLQIDHCCVDYRPLNLSVWTFLTVEHFSICSNIIAESAFSQIRLLLDDSALFISKRCNREVNLLRDYVCVAEVDQFKIWLQFCYDKSGKQRTPKSDLRFMVNELNLHTCADSTTALLELIQYIVNDGDMVEKNDQGDVTPTATEEAPQFISDEDHGDSKIPSPVLPSITPEQEASVKSALEDAMIDCPEPIKHKPTPTKHSQGQMTRVFFQCDNPKQVSLLTNEFENAMHITVSDSSDSNTPDEDGGMGDTEDFEIVDCNFREVTNIKGSHEVHLLTQQPIEVNENFIRKPTSSYDHLKAPDRFPEPEYQYTLREMSVVWHIYGGSDFSPPRRGSSSERPNLARGLQSSPRDQRKFDGSGRTRRHSWRHRGGDWRDFNILMELELNKIRFRYDVYPSNTKQASRFKLLVNSFEVRDRIKSSEVNKFLVKLVDKEHPEQSSAYMLMFSGVFTRPEYLPSRTECEVKAFCLPIKLNIDQVSLNFLWKFVSQVSDPDTAKSDVGSVGGRSSPLGGHSSPSSSSPRNSVSNLDPIMRIGIPSTNESSLDETELLMKFEDYSNQQSLYLQARLNENDNLELPHEDLPVFIKSFILISDITIKLDYRGKRCDMDSGVVGMMLGVASLTGSVVKLKRINCQKGILGWDKLLMYAYNEWLTDIKTNQIHSILKGVGSLSIVFQIVQGVTDLIRLPIEQYQKDRRIIRGLQRGANSFTLNTVMAILELTNKVVGSIQYCAELGYDMMSPGPSVRRRKMLKQRRQPRTTAEGAKAAFALVTEGVRESASNLSAIVSEESAHKGYVGAVGGALRNATPECLFKPLALLAEAGTNIVQGVRNEVDPSKMKEEEDRWK